MKKEPEDGTLNRLLSLTFNDNTGSGHDIPVHDPLHVITYCRALTGAVRLLSMDRVPPASIEIYLEVLKQSRKVETLLAQLRMKLMGKQDIIVSSPTEAADRLVRILKDLKQGQRIEIKRIRALQTEFLEIEEWLLALLQSSALRNTARRTAVMIRGWVQTPAPGVLRQWKVSGVFK